MVLVVPQLRTRGRLKWILICFGTVHREGIISGHFQVGFWWKLVLGIEGVFMQCLYLDQCGLRNLHVKGIS